MSNNETRYGLLIDYNFCTGCHTCEVACKKELNLPVGQWGIKVLQDGPRKISDDHWEWNNIPVITEQCNLCEDRVAMGKKPACVHHCQAAVMTYGPLSELIKKMDNKKMALFTAK